MITYNDLEKKLTVSGYEDCFSVIVTVSKIKTVVVNEEEHEQIDSRDFELPIHEGGCFIVDNFLEPTQTVSVKKVLLPTVEEVVQ